MSTYPYQEGTFLNSIEILLPRGSVSTYLIKGDIPQLYKEYLLARESVSLTFIKRGHSQLYRNTSCSREVCPLYPYQEGTFLNSIGIPLPEKCVHLPYQRGHSSTSIGIPPAREKVCPLTLIKRGHSSTL